MKLLTRIIVAGIFCTLFWFSPLAAAEPKVNMNVIDTEVRDVLTALADIGQVNIVFDDSKSSGQQSGDQNSKITIKMRNIPFYDALELVTKMKGLTYQKVGDVIVVAANNKMSRQFGTIQIIKLNYIPAENVIDTLTYILNPELKADGQAGSSDSSTQSNATNAVQSLTKLGTAADFAAGQRKNKGGNSRIQFDGATNSLVFFGTAAEAEQIRKVLAELDIPYQQVSLEAEVVELSKKAAKDLGISWKWDPAPASTGGTTTGTTTSTTADTAAGKGVIKFGKSPAGTPYQFNYQATINALVSEQQAKILAKPNVKTINGKIAKIFIGDRIPSTRTIRSATDTTTEANYEEIGIILNYLPQIHADGQITAKVYTGVSYPVWDEKIKLYSFSTRQAETEVRVKDGETIVIGGLINNTESREVSKIPFLGDLPILGKLFQNVSKTKDETEVVIFLTARIIK